MTFEINKNELKENLLGVYTHYVSKDEKTKYLGINKAKELDGLWSGSFLLEEELEEAINNLTAMYTNPKLSKEKAEKILNKIKNVKID